MVVLIATDGVPDDMGHFTQVLQNRDSDRIFVSILACSDVESEIGYLNLLDKVVKHLDVIDDFRSEKKEIARVNPFFGSVYSMGDHVARYLLGGVYDKYDKLDGL